MSDLVENTEDRVSNNKAHLPYVCVDYIGFDCHLFGKSHSLGYICYLCIMSICCFSYSHFGFDDRILVLIVPVPGICLLFTINHANDAKAL